MLVQCTENLFILPIESIIVSTRAIAAKYNEIEECLLCGWTITWSINIYIIKIKCLFTALPSCETNLYHTAESVQTKIPVAMQTFLHEINYFRVCILAA